MRRVAAAALVAGILASAAGAFLVSNSPVGSKYVFEHVPANRRPIDFKVDTEAVPDVTDPIGIVQQEMDQWNGVAGAQAPFGTATAGGPYNGSTVGSTFGTFSNTTFEVAWDDDGAILNYFGLSTSVLGITLKSVDIGKGELLDMLVVINTSPGALVAPGTGATAEDLFRATLLHELGHATGLAHSPVGIVNPTTFGLAPVPVQRMPTMFAYRLPQLPQEGATIEADDRAGLVDIYPADTSGFGSISGTVRGASGAGVNQIAVRAVGPAGAGEGHIGALTDEDRTGLGHFSIRHLLPGPYRVVLEPVNGRAGVTGDTLLSNTGSLGSDPFIYARDEFWQPGDTYDLASDAPGTFAFVQVRAGRETGSIDFVLDATPIEAGVPVNNSFANGDSQVPDATGGFHFADYYLFAGTAGQSVTIDATGTGTVPQIRVLRPSNLAIVAEDLPVLTAASVTFTLPDTGAYTLVVSSRATTGNPGGTGNYLLNLSGASGTLPPVPPLTPAAATQSPLGDLAFSSPVCDAAMLLFTLKAPSAEELWVDALTLRASGTANDAMDVSEVSLVEDTNGNGQRDGGEPVLATGTFATNDGTLTFGGLGIQMAPGSEKNLLVVYDVSVKSVSSAPQAASFPWWILLGLLLPLVFRRRRVLVALPLLLATCGGGGGGGCNGTFNPDGAVVTMQVTVAPGDLTAFTSTTDPASPLALPASPLASDTLSVSNE
jgi:hypothetical protein